MAKGSDLLVAALENEGVTQIFGVPGEENLDVVEFAPKLEDRADCDASRADRGVSCGNLRAADRQARRLHQHARPGRPEPRHRRCLRTPRRDADGDDHRPEGHHVEPPGPVPDRRHDRDHAAPDQVDPADRQHRDNPDVGARGVQGGYGGTTGAGPPRAARGHRRRGGAGRAAGAAARDRPAGGASGRARPRGGDDPRGEAPAGDARRRREPAAACGRPERLLPAAAAAVLHHPDGQGLGCRRLEPLHGNRRALGARLCARCDRPGRPDPRHRPRHHREAAVHHGAGRAEGDPRRLHARLGRAGLFPRRRGGRRRRPEPGALGRPPRGPAAA